METYITICKIESQVEFAVQLRKLKQGLCFKLEGLDGDGDSKGDICIPKAVYCHPAYLTSMQSTS